jgi:hypothetical protein
MNRHRVSPHRFNLLYVLFALCGLVHCDCQRSTLLAQLKAGNSTPYVLTGTSTDPIQGASGTSRNGQGKGFQHHMHQDHVQILLDGQEVAQFVFRDKQIRRPYFANLKLPGNVQVTRNQPPIASVDAIDHDTMHPGLWLGFGDINGSDFWRNKGEIEHVRFLAEPSVENGRLSFSTECQLVSEQGESIGLMQNRFVLWPMQAKMQDGAENPIAEAEDTHATHPHWLLVWEASLQADRQSIRLGDQEEMGFGARVATAITEKNGGRILNSSGQQSAQLTWGQPADWCDYSGTIGGQPAGFTLMADRQNFRQSWWHNRDYGVFVANPFGRQAMKQGIKSEVKIEPGQSLTLRFGAFLHQGIAIDYALVFKAFEEARVVRADQPKL